jgi:S1-C subfamily serine protease
LVASTAPSVTTVQSHRSRSSGFVWPPGLIVTADEVLSEDGEFAVTLSGGDTMPAQLVGRDPTTDVALLRVDRSDLRFRLNVAGTTKLHGGRSFTTRPRGGS